MYNPKDCINHDDGYDPCLEGGPTWSDNNPAFEAISNGFDNAISVISTGTGPINPAKGALGVAKDVVDAANTYNSFSEVGGGATVGDHMAEAVMSTNLGSQIGALGEVVLERQAEAEALGIDLY
ncbi:hypothetical protein AB4179_10220 [Vibrio lentus]|uniref:hypothetical protein n=1 Tax=Vibrio lentus TaxID=136468 RepID=UPI00246991A9|nr:hypothetical protein [Vibrio lentus]MDH5925375.1 hypothetical protein [Vibrio lentus]